MQKMFYESTSAAATVAVTDDNNFGDNCSVATAVIAAAVSTVSTTIGPSAEPSFIAHTTNLFSPLNRSAASTTLHPFMHDMIANLSSSNPLHLFDANKNHTRDLNQFSTSASADAASHEIRLSALSMGRTCLVVFFTIIILITIFGNTLVILSVTTTRRLRTVTNCFVMSLALADWMVGVFVMPPAVLLYIYGSWSAGRILCEIWISLDILLCTASILSLCAISLDRYLAVTQPLNYKKRRTKRLALIMIFIVWVVALSITCPPILGWYEPGRHNRESGEIECRYNHNKGYVIFSAMGSFFIPMTVMLYVYSRICCVLTSRHNSMTKTEASEKTIADDIDCDNMTSEYESSQSPRSKSLARITGNHSIRNNYSQKSFDQDDSHHTLYELVDLSKSMSTIRSTSMSCKYSTCIGSQQQHHPQQLRISPQTVHFCHSQTSISESCASGVGKNRTLSNGKRMPIRISSMKRETKAAQTLSMVIGGFVACWMPFFVYYLSIPFLEPNAVSEILVSFLTWLGWINSAINPFIYAFYNADFRIAFWRLTFRKCCKNQKSLMFLKA